MPIYFETFVLDILAGSHTLCGDMTYYVFYDGATVPIDSNSSPLATSVGYSTTLSLQTDNQLLINTTAPYTIVA